MEEIKFIDLFCGLGGIRIGLEKAMMKLNKSSKCLLSSDIKDAAIITYEKNFKEKVFYDVKKIETKNIGDFDILLGGFPCQAFSNAGKRRGFEDARGTLFFELARILHDKKPSSFIFENVEGLVSHDSGKTLTVILDILSSLGYSVEWKVLNASDFGLAQNRKRIYIVGVYGKYNMKDIFSFDTKFSEVVFKDIREFNMPIKNSKFNKVLNEFYSDLSFLNGKSIKDKRGGENNIHSWDISLKGKINKRQKNLLKIIITKRRYKKWAIENKTAWFDGIPLSFKQIETLTKYNELQSDLDLLVELGYLKLEYPKDYKIINDKKEKVTREDLPIGYTLTTGKLSFEFTKILNGIEKVPTIVATDAARLGVIEKTGIRSLTNIELKRLFGFDDKYITTHLKDSDLFDLFGNSVAINVVECIAMNLLNILRIKNGYRNE
jgi:DNA (cytosine-5)-methyltransferase 1